LFLLENHQLAIRPSLLSVLLELKQHVQVKMGKKLDFRHYKNSVPKTDSAHSQKPATDNASILVFTSGSVSYAFFGFVHR
jgi:hypothetical protein